MKDVAEGSEIVHVPRGDGQIGQSREIMLKPSSFDLFTVIYVNDIYNSPNKEIRKQFDPLVRQYIQSAVTEGLFGRKILDESNLQKTDYGKGYNARRLTWHNVNSFADLIKRYWTEGFMGGADVESFLPYALEHAATVGLISKKELESVQDIRRQFLEQKGLANTHVPSGKYVEEVNDETVLNFEQLKQKRKLLEEQKKQKANNIYGDNHKITKEEFALFEEDTKALDNQLVTLQETIDSLERPYRIITSLRSYLGTRNLILKANINISGEPSARFDIAGPANESFIKENSIAVEDIAVFIETIKNVFDRRDAQSGEKEVEDGQIERFMEKYRCSRGIVADVLKQVQFMRGLQISDRKIHRALVLKYHPDRNPSSNQEFIKFINSIYQSSQEQFSI